MPSAAHNGPPAPAPAPGVRALILSALCGFLAPTPPGQPIKLWERAIEAALNRQFAGLSASVPPPTPFKAELQRLRACIIKLATPAINRISC